MRQKPMPPYISRTTHSEDPERYLRAVSDLAASLTQPRELDDFLWDFSRQVTGSLGLTDCVVYLLDRNQGELIQRAAAGPKNPRGKEILDPITIPVGKGIVGTVARTGVGEIVPDTRRDHRYILDDDFRLSELTVPILWKGEVIGIVDSEHPKEAFFTPAQRQVLTTMVAMCSERIGSGLATEKKRRDEAKRLLTTRRLQQDYLSALGWYASESRKASHGKKGIVETLNHELRTPLNSILGFSSILLDESSDQMGQEERQMIELIARNGRELFERIEYLLELPKHGLLEPIRSAPVEISSLIRESTHRFQQAGDDESVAIRTEIPGELDLVETDRNLLGRALTYVLENALKFTESGEVKVRVRADESNVPSRIEVIDTGIGIEADELEKIFDPFYQVDRGLTRRRGGLGLGLTLAKLLIHRLGFDLTVVSEPRRGSVFSIWM